MQLKIANKDKTISTNKLIFNNKSYFLYNNIFYYLYECYIKKNRLKKKTRDVVNRMNDDIKKRQYK